MAVKKSNWMKAGDSTVAVDRINGKPKKLTGTRLGAVFGLNPWKTPFQAWCEITRVAEPPFEGNKFTEAGQVIEPKLIERCREYVSPDVVTPEEFYGTDDPKRKTGYDFFEDKVFGGMWDALYKVGDGIRGVIECKTSSRPQDWEDGVPEHYAVQGLLYAYLLGLDDVWFIVAFLSPEDYDDPAAFECTEDNTVLYHMTVSDEFRESTEQARLWWSEHVFDGAESPVFDEKKDAEYLDLMRTNQISNADGLELVDKRIAELRGQIARIREENSLDALENELKAMTDRLKAMMIEELGPTDKKSVFKGWVLAKSERTSVNSTRLKEDGIYDKYAEKSVSYRLTEKKGE